MPYDMPIPDFLKEDEETIHRRMLEKAPSGISTREGDFFWDATRPGAIEAAEMNAVQLPEVLRVALPQYSYGIWLRLLGALRGVWEKEAVKAQTKVVINAVPGTVIPAGTIVVVPADANQPAIEFATLEKGNVDETGTISLLVEAVATGTAGNVNAGTIVALRESIEGIQSVTNPEPATGGTDPEDDESFRERMLYSYQDPPLSGAKSDYERWALEVPGVGRVFVDPLWSGAGTVKVMILDASGAPASQALVGRVQDYIAPDGRNGGGVAPIGALVTVAPPDVMAISVDYIPILGEGFDVSAVNSEFEQALQQYFAEVGAGGVVKYNKIGAILMGVTGIKDYSGLFVNNATENIQLANTEVAVLGVVTPDG
jgi:uncharacterized phage protein gp47/JayE